MLAEYDKYAKELDINHMFFFLATIIHLSNKSSINIFKLENEKITELFCSYFLAPFCISVKYTCLAKLLL